MLGIQFEGQKEIEQLPAMLQAAIDPEFLQVGFKLKDLQDKARNKIKELFPAGAAFDRHGDRNTPLRDGWVTTKDEDGFILRHRAAAQGRVATIINALDSGSLPWVLPNQEPTMMSVMRSKARMRYGSNRSPNGRFRARPEIPLIPDKNRPGNVVFFANGDVNIPAREGYHFMQKTVDFINDYLENVRTNYYQSVADKFEGEQ